MTAATRLHRPPRHHASTTVLLSRYRFKVIRVDAASHAASVIDLQPRRDCSPPQLICGAMCPLIVLLPVRLDAQLAVTIDIKRQQPQPTSRPRNGHAVVEDSIGEWARLRPRPVGARPALVEPR